MNTSGHEGVAKDAGIPLLEDAFGKDMRSLTALYLGNWLTDVSQAVDPVANWVASSKAKKGVSGAVDAAKEAIDNIIEEVVATLFDVEGPVGRRVLKAMKPDLEPIADQMKAALLRKIDFLIGVEPNERGAVLASFFRDALLVKGYFKFVHPDTPNDAQRMKFECFMRVFGRTSDTRGASGGNVANDRPGAFTQYYPHEHLDRPEMLPPDDPAIYAPGRQMRDYPFRLAQGKPSGLRAARSNHNPIDPDLYSYLRDQMEMTAGLFAEVDKKFERVAKRGFRDDDPDWHLTLAKLGHALHQVEDFFAHSNWVELAFKRLGKKYLAKAIPPETKLEIIDRAYTTYSKRLKRHLTEPLPEWRKHPEEEWVVSGFFDFRDTLISMAHMSEHLWGGDVPDPFAAGYGLVQTVEKSIGEPKTVAHEIQKKFRDTFAFLSDPQGALDDRDNDVAKSLRTKFEPDIRILRRPGVSGDVAEQVINETKSLQDAPKDVRDAFFNVIVEGSRSYKMGDYFMTIYDTVQDISIFMKSPQAWLAKWLPDQIKKRLFDALKFYGRERFYDWIGSGRIGCHSLIAKDHGNEPFYKQQRECSTAVHWYVVKTLLRWEETDDAKHIDWKELLEYFLRNPIPPANPFRTVEVDIPVNITHTVKHKEQLKADDPQYSLEARYRRTAFEPAKFSWRMIADANFNTADLPEREAQNAIYTILKDSVWGVKVAPPNYAFKAGLRLSIPNQRLRLKVLVPTGDDMPWFQSVIDKGWKVFRGYDDPDAETSHGPLVHHQPITISHNELEKIIARGKELRLKAREAYRPPH